jgi:phage terminase large subunit-like protein
MISSLAQPPEPDRQTYLLSLTDSEAEALLYDWSFLARLNRLPAPGDRRTWLIFAGRGFGKSRSGAEGSPGCCPFAPMEPSDVEAAQTPADLAEWRHGHNTQRGRAGRRGPQFDGRWADEPAS